MKKLLLGLSLLLSAGEAVAQPTTTVSPQFYLNVALGYIQSNALNASKVNWPEVMAQAVTVARKARITLCFLLVCICFNRQH